MIKRLYIHNFRSLVNFELPIGDLATSLLIGGNGSGKSSVGQALEILRQIGKGNNRIGNLVKPSDMTRWLSGQPVRFEIEADLSGVRYVYHLALELPKNFRELRIMEENLEIDGDLKFTRNVAEIIFPRPDGDPATMSFDWHLSWLSVAQARSENDPIDIFRKWLARMLVLGPIPALISGESTDETLTPDNSLLTLGDWWNGLIAHSPAAYAPIASALRRMLPDMSDIKNPVIAKDSRSLEVHFAHDEKTLVLPFSVLSDGEKCMVIWAMVMAANNAYGPLFCFWDEPDNYLALSEIANFATDLRKAFAEGGQFLATSHNPETIRSFSDENTFVLFRRHHHEPTRVRPLSDIGYGKDLVAALTRGDIEP